MHKITLTETTRTNQYPDIVIPTIQELNVYIYGYLVYYI